ncbi:MAG: V4R domain-containing protein [Promethearchaeota archaeon]
MTGSNVSRIFLNNLVNAFMTTITLEYLEADKIIRHSGEYLGKAYADMFKADTLEGTLKKLKKFWAQNGMGTIKDVKIDKNLTTFKVYDCFECWNMPNIGKCVCKFDEGFIEKSLSQSLEREFDVKEVKCIANGDDYCEFEIKPR